MNSVLFYVLYFIFLLFFFGFMTFFLLEVFDDTLSIVMDGPHDSLIENILSEIFIVISTFLVIVLGGIILLLIPFLTHVVIKFYEHLLIKINWEIVSAIEIMSIFICFFVLCLIKKGY